MKKLLSFFAIAAMLLVVSCNKPQEFLGDEGDLASIHFSVMGDLMTKANSDFATGTKVDKLAVQAFILGSDEAYHLTNANITITPVTGASPLAWDVDMKLAKNRAYKIAFFAYKDGTGIYGVENLSAITVDYSKIAINSDDADAFSAARSLTVTGALSETVELYRPLAQLNIGVSDWEEYKNSTLEEMQDINVAISVNSVPNGLNLIGGETADDGSVAATVSGENTVEFARVDVLDVDDELVTGYDYFAMVYVLASKDKENMTFTADFEFGDETSVDISNIEITNMPFQANYRTNVLGQLLTGNIHYDVEIVPGFMTPDYEKLLAPEFESVAALNDYFATMADNSDDGDVEPEVVSISAAADGDVIKLPKIAGGVVIRVNAVCDGTLTVQYADGASDTQKPANVYLYVKKATNLVVNLPASHVELIDDSWVTGTVTATTSGDTFVVSKKAKVGKVEIKQGNTEIGGEVNNVEVAAGATADGTNPVEVFLAKESAVAHIDLNAPANVVVEQPADNIDKAATENKVSVDVNVNGCSATAQNGGQIYVKVADGIECTVAADGKDGDVPSGVKIAEVGDGASVDSYQSDGGVVVVEAGVDADQVNTKDYEAKIGDKYYQTVPEAFAAANANDVVTVLVENYTKINDGTFNVDVADYLAEGFVSYPNADGTFSVLPGIMVKHNGTDDTDKSHTANGNMLKNAVQNAADGTTIYLTAGIYWLPGNDFRFPDNKSFNIIGIGDVQIFSNGYGFAVNKSEHEGIAVTLKNLTITNGPNKPNAVYIKDYMVLTLEDVVLHNYAVANKYSIVLDSSNPINDAFDSNKTTTVIAKNVSIDEGLKIGLMAMPRQYYIDKGYSATISTKCSVTYDGKCVNFEGNVEAQNGEPCSTGSNLIVNGVALPEPPVAPTEFNVSTAADFISVFSDNAIRTKNTQININADIDLSNAEAHSPIDISNMDKASITVNGNNHTIKGMKKPMFDQCFVASISVNNLTFKDCDITEASDGYVAVIAAYYDAGKFLNIENVTFDNCDLTGSNYAGLIYGAGGGYGNQNDGPVHMGAVVKNCSATDCDLVSTGGGSVGAIAGHAAWNDWTKLTVEDCTVTNCTMTTSKAVKAGSFFGTVGIAGSVVYGRQCGIYVKNCTWSGNVATAKDVVSPYIFGRVAQNGGELYVYDSVESDYVLAAYNHGSGDVVEREDLVSENRFSQQ